IASAVSPYAVARPGDSPFQQPQHSGGGGLAQGLVLLGALLVSAPVLWWAWLAIIDGSGSATLALWSGLGIGTVVLVLGVLIGAAAFRRRDVRIMEFAESV